MRQLIRIIKECGHRGKVGHIYEVIESNPREGFRLVMPGATQYTFWYPMDCCEPAELGDCIIPTTDSVSLDRKKTPVFTGVLKYFPDAIREVSRVSLAGNEQHHPDEPLHWDRKKSTDELDALSRHLLDAGTFDTDGIRHSAKVAWRALANLQKELELSSES